MCAETLEDEARVRNRHGNGLGSAGEKEKEREMRWQFWGSGWIPQVSALGGVLILFVVIVVAGVKLALSPMGEIGSAT